MTNLEWGYTLKQTKNVVRDLPGVCPSVCRSDFVTTSDNKHDDNLTSVLAWSHPGDILGFDVSDTSGLTEVSNLQDESDCIGKKT